MTFMIIWQDVFKISITRAENVFRLSVGRVVLVLFLENMETRQLELMQEIDAASEFLCHILGFPAVRDVLSEIPDVEQSHEGVIFHCPDGNFVVPECSLKSWASKEAA